MKQLKDNRTTTKAAGGPGGAGKSTLMQAGQQSITNPGASAF